MQSVFLALIVAISVANAHQHAGCYVENPNARDFSILGSYKSQFTSANTCAGQCQQFAYFSLTNGGDCYCSNTPPFLAKATESDCNVNCPGSAGGKCGGGTTRSSVYVTFTNAMGCYRDQGHLQLNLLTQLSGATLESCDYLCRARGRNTYALASGGQCWCGNNDIDVGSPNYGVVSQGCNMPCSANTIQNCGGSDYNKYVYQSISYSNVIAAAPALYHGCHYDLTNGVRDFNDASDTTGAHGGVALCALFCAKKGNYSFFGVQNGKDCYCSNHAPNQAVAPESDCNQNCMPNTDWEMCGGANRNGVWQRCSNYIGCVKWDQWSLPTYKQVDAGANVESCTASCRSKAFTNAFVLNYGACYCTNGTNTQVVSDSSCNMPCNSNPTEMCGGDYYHSAYTTDACLPYSASNTKGGMGHTSARSVFVKPKVVDVGGNGNVAN